MENNRVTKTCNKCGKLEEHSIKKSGTHQYHCMKCQREYSRLNYLKMKTVHNPARYEKREENRKLLKEFMKEVKSQPCTDCKIAYHPFVMDFDHLSDKDFVISVGVRNNVSLDRLKAEIKKCELVCANCHRMRTWNRLTDLDL